MARYIVPAVVHPDMSGQPAVVAHASQVLTQPALQVFSVILHICRQAMVMHIPWHMKYVWPHVWPQPIAVKRHDCDGVQAASAGASAGGPSVAALSWLPSRLGPVASCAASVGPPPSLDGPPPSFPGSDESPPDVPTSLPVIPASATPGEGSNVSKPRVHPVPAALLSATVTSARETRDAHVPMGPLCRAWLGGATVHSTRQRRHTALP
jgi:hypothetical protein